MNNGKKNLAESWLEFLSIWTAQVFCGIVPVDTERTVFVLGDVWERNFTSED